jgi:DNA-binding MarR family transcriptional regulator
MVAAIPPAPRPAPVAGPYCHPRLESSPKSNGAESHFLSRPCPNSASEFGLRNRTIGAGRGNHFHIWMVRIRHPESNDRGWARSGAKSVAVDREVSAIWHDPCAMTDLDRLAMTDLDDLDLWPPERPGRRSDPSISRSVLGAYHALSRRLRISTREHGLGASEAMVLAYLLRQPGCAPVVARHALGLHRSTLSSLLDRLERKGLIRRAPSTYDGRRLEIDLTAAGTIAAGIAESVIRDVEAELGEYTSPTERRGAEAVFAACIAMTNPGGSLEF